MDEKEKKEREEEQAKKKKEQEEKSEEQEAKEQKAEEEAQAEQEQENAEDAPHPEEEKTEEKLIKRSVKALDDLLRQYDYIGSESQIALVAKNFAPSIILQLMFVLTPDIVNQYLICYDSPMAHKILYEIVSSAKHECFLKLVQLAVTRACPEDENALFECLNVFKSATNKGR